MQQSKKRPIWEINFARGIAIILMMIFHFAFNLREFYGYNIDYNSGFIYIGGEVAKVLFITTAGISSTFSRNNLKRGGKLFGIAMALTVITYIVSPSIFINFGILHFLSIGMIIYHFINRLPVPVLGLISVISYVLGRVFSTMIVESRFLFPLGLVYRGFVSMDYFPIFPWIGLFIFGGILGNLLYKEKKSLLSWQPKVSYISYLGEHSLIIYLVHQPVFLAILFLADKLGI